MPTSKHIAHYSDIAVFAEKLIVGEPATLTFDSKPAAIKWRQRFYTYRKLYLREQDKVKGAGMGSTPWDNIILRNHPDNPKALRVEWHEAPALTFDNEIVEKQTDSFLGLESTTAPALAEEAGPDPKKKLELLLKGKTND